VRLILLVLPLLRDIILAVAFLVLAWRTPSTAALALAAWKPTVTIVRHDYRPKRPPNDD
jgi:hypothetical protein